MLKVIQHLYLKANKGTDNLFIKLDEDLISSIFDILYDEGYDITSSNEHTWNRMCENRRSYIVITKQDLSTFKVNRLALLQKVKT